MDKVVLAVAIAIGVLFLGSAAPPASTSLTQPSLLRTQSGPTLVPGSHVGLKFGHYAGRVCLKPRVSLEPPPPPPPPPPTAQEALRRGVLIVVSLSSQHAFVFKKGDAWDSTRVSTGKPGNDTPEGVFPILQKKVLHRSNLYDDAPMPYMQRLTWDGVALHAGRVHGYPASHGCVRLPHEFAKKLYAITNFSSTVVVVTNERVASAKEARKLA